MVGVVSVVGSGAQGLGFRVLERRWLYEASVQF